MSDVKLVLVTYPVGGENDKNVSALASMLIKEKLAACVNRIKNVESYYQWEGELNVDKEEQLIIKTREGRISELKKRLIEKHPYDVPEIIILDVEDGSDSYMDWVRKNTT